MLQVESFSNELLSILNLLNRALHQNNKWRALPNKNCVAAWRATS